MQMETVTKNDFEPQGDMPVPPEILTMILARTDPVGQFVSRWVCRHWAAYAPAAMRPWYGFTTAAAACGYTRVLEWARANGCPWDTTTCYAAARAGHMRLLVWLNKNECPWDSETFTALAKHGDRAMLE
ncbi:ankyrin repeat protein [Pandoravirus inopinatum]|uniref:Ankyrin repeat protein n=1 Tax=Pandoravirus inopinatum TaxID=1605721 RepID=A0A0B5J188_9VIRU|nr:ankyrin repeat protein [Pandoravirus inopinatum]AJF97224.1 ankyrin repeat protein [Pandoravirus inopinatum]